MTSIMIYILYCYFKCIYYFVIYHLIEFNLTSCDFTVFLSSFESWSAWACHPPPGGAVHPPATPSHRSCLGKGLSPRACGGLGLCPGPVIYCSHIQYSGVCHATLHRRSPVWDVPLPTCCPSPTRRGRFYRNRTGDVVTWCIGHLLEQAEPDAYDAAYKQWRMESLPIVPAQWQLVAAEDQDPAHRHQAADQTGRLRGQRR